jgi:hypothetical protein
MHAGLLDDGARGWRRPGAQGGGCEVGLGGGVHKGNNLVETFSSAVMFATGVHSPTTACDITDNPNRGDVQLWDCSCNWRLAAVHAAADQYVAAVDRIGYALLHHALLLALVHVRPCSCREQAGERLYMPSSSGNVWHPPSRCCQLSAFRLTAEAAPTSCSLHQVCPACCAVAEVQ